MNTEIFSEFEQEKTGVTEIGMIAYSPFSLLPSVKNLYDAS